MWLSNSQNWMCFHFKLTAPKQEEILQIILKTFFSSNWWKQWNECCDLTEKKIFVRMWGTNSQNSKDPALAAAAAATQNLVKTSGRGPPEFRVVERVAYAHPVRDHQVYYVPKGTDIWKQKIVDSLAVHTEVSFITSKEHQQTKNLTGIRKIHVNFINFYFLILRSLEKNMTLLWFIIPCIFSCYVFEQNAKK